MLEMLFNRWRGTGKIIWKINGNTIYAIYWALLVGFVSGIWYWGLLFGGLYILGESFAWGKWIGYIVMPEPERSEYKPKEDGDYINDDGISFPWIHYISNFFIKQRKDYLNYCRLALFFRGFFWWILPLSLLLFLNLIVLWQFIFGLVVVSIGFPVAGELSRLYNPHIVTKYFVCDNNWETQEVIYGFFHFIGITLMILI